MRHRCRGVTITELLTVVALVTILTSFLGPVITTVKHAAIARSCSNNLRQCYTALQMCANASNGKFMPCFELNTTDSPLQIKDNYPVKEDSWWYRKLFAKLYPQKDIDAASPTPGAPVPARTYILPEYLALRCPSSLDPHDQNRVYQTRQGYKWYEKTDSNDKDRVYDDNYGYTNYGFRYGGGRQATPSIPDPVTDATAKRWGVVGNTYYYRSTGTNWGAITGRPTHLRHAQKPSDATQCLCGVAWDSCPKKNRCDCDVDYPAPYGKEWPCPYARIGEFAGVPEPGRTMLMMDYVKADVAPNLTNDFLRGYRFRHGGRGNTLFVDGHVDLMSRQDFRRNWGEPDHGAVAYAKDPVTQRARIHWAVLRPGR